MTLFLLWNFHWSLLQLMCTSMLARLAVMMAFHAANYALIPLKAILYRFQKRQWYQPWWLLLSRNHASRGRKRCMGHKLDDSPILSLESDRQLRYRFIVLAAGPLRQDKWSMRWSSPWSWCRLQYEPSNHTAILLCRTAGQPAWHLYPKKAGTVQQHSIRRDWPARMDT